MGMLGFLIVFPLVAALLCLVLPDGRARDVVVYAGAGVVALASVIVASSHLGGASRYYTYSSEVLSWVFLAVELGLCAYVMWRALTAKRHGVFCLACVQALLVCVLEFGVAGHVAVRHAVYVDTLSAIMALVIGIIGGGICVYAVGYMRDFQRHAEELAERDGKAAPDRRNVFFAIMFAFLAAMFAVVFFNDLAWLLAAWEVTTVCSFVLIGYTRTPEATNNAFRQIWMNMVGGIAFTLGLIAMGSSMGVMELDRFVSLGRLMPSVAMLPLALLALAAMTKAAQMPFHTWLLGAMVAPTPTSALLHSSTMVKAGVFLLIRLSPLMGTFVNDAPRLGLNPVGVGVMLVGGVTFLLCSMAAVSQSNAKRVLAYSTIANLGLIVACAGIGSAAAIWAAIFLLVFHAAAKSLLFLCVGTAEHHIGSRDIESMDALVARTPRLACLMALGICGMFVAPFGMLVSKWAALGAFVNSGVLALVVMLAFGSAVTFFFWGKWLTKILSGMRATSESLEAGVHASEWVALGTMATLTALLAVLLPVISADVVSPYVSTLVGGRLAEPSGADLVVMAVCAVVMIVVPALFALRAKTLARPNVPVNMGGVGTSATTFRGSLGEDVTVGQRNWYLTEIFSERRVSLVGTVICGLLAFSTVACALGMNLAFLGGVI